MIELLKELWFKPRHLISDGYDESLARLSEIVPMKIHEIPSGTKCWTWVVPEKWNIKEAYIEDMEGNRLLDVQSHPLHVISYSLPINKVVGREELMKHIHTKPDRPDAIPYEFKYYERDWGFCIPHNRLPEFGKDRYKVVIDSEFVQGTLKVGEYTIPGKTKETIAFVAHLCHPAMANDDMAGVAVLMDIAKELQKRDNRYTYAFFILPETIGSIAYLSQNEERISDFKCGIFLEMLGNSTSLALQRTRQDTHRLDRIARYVMKHRLRDFREAAFQTLVGNDEFVFNGPGVDVPMISISRFPYPEYHTSDDNIDIISEESLQESKGVVMDIVDILEQDYIPKRTFKGPVFLSGNGLWVDWRVNKTLNENLELIMLRLEGDKSCFDIAEELEMDFADALDYISKLFEKGFVEKV